MVNVEHVIEVKELVAVESTGIDLSEFEGSKAKIENLEIVQVPSTFSKTGKQDCLKVLTAVVTQTETKEGMVDVRASELFNLTRDPETKKMGYSKHKKAGLHKFLNKMWAKNPEDLIGKSVTIVLRQNGEKTFLGFLKE